MSLGYRPKNWIRPQKDIKDMMGLAVALHSCDGLRLSREIDELGVRHILLRVPLWETERLEEHVAFVESLPECTFAICIMQDGEHVADADLWRRNLRRVVRAFWPRVTDFQIGQGINRSKWGFLSVAQFLEFASEAEELRDEFPGIRFVGPSVLDFETTPFLRSIAHGYPISWDVVSCGLYVDRRGSPRNRQMLFFDFTQKIYRFASCILLANKGSRRMWITEVNWPLSGEGSFAPTGEAECVSEEEAAIYLREYYEDAWKSQLLERVYWWQLVAKGYGLMDTEDDGSLRKRPAYHAFKRLLQGD